MAYIGKEPGSGLRGRFIYTATAGQTSFTGADSLGRTLTYTDGEYTDVFLNGVKLDKTDYTATSGTSIVLDSGASADDTLEILAFDTFGLFSGEFAQDVSVSGDLTVDTSTLKVDSTNNRVGVGTASPAFALDVQSASDPAEIRLKEDGNTNGLRITNFDGDEAQINNVDNGPLVIKTNNTERMRVLSDGKVGLGTTTPETPIEIETANTLGGTFTGTTAGEGLRVTQSSYTDGNFVSLVEAPYQPNGVPNVRIGASFTSSGSIMAFGTSNSFGSGITVRAMSINQNGNIHIGRDTGPPSTSDPNGCKIENNGRIVNGRDVSGTANVLVCNGNAGAFRVMGDGDAQNTNNSFTGISDEALKENIVDATSQWDDIKAVKVRKFSFKSDNKSSPTHIGVIAQELEASGMNGLVKEVEVDTDPEETVKTVKYSILYMKAVKALQEAMARIETLETKVATLEGN